MKKAFTMIELIFVIVILGILASVAIPRLMATRDDAAQAAIREGAMNFISDVAGYYISQGGFPTNPNQKNIQNMTNQKVQFFYFDDFTKAQAGGFPAFKIKDDPFTGNNQIKGIKGFLYSPNGYKCFNFILSEGLNNDERMVPAFITLVYAPASDSYRKICNKVVENIKTHDKQHSQLARIFTRYMPFKLRDDVNSSWRRGDIPNAIEVGGRGVVF